MKIRSHHLLEFKEADFTLSPLSKRDHCFLNKLATDGCRCRQTPYLQQQLYKPILQSDDVISTDPATRDVVAAYEGTTMSQTKIWDIQVYLRPQDRRVMRRGNRMWQWLDR